MGNEALFGKNAVIIGGTSSIGLETAILLAKNGMKVTAFGRTAPKESDDTKEICFVEWDLELFFETIETGAEENPVIKAVKNADILVNCYGPFLQKSLDQVSAKEWQKLALADYALPGSLISIALPHMIKNNFGRIVLFGGTRTESVKPYRTNAAYAGAKTGTAVLVKSVASEYSRNGITCNQILPGFTRNCPPTTEPVSNKMLAEKVLFLIENQELNGVLLNVDRGWNP